MLTLGTIHALIPAMPTRYADVVMDGEAVHGMRPEQRGTFVVQLMEGTDNTGHECIRTVTVRGTYADACAVAEAWERTK